MKKKFNQYIETVKKYLREERKQASFSDGSLYMKINVIAKFLLNRDTLRL